MRMQMETVCSLIHAAVTAAPYFAFHENVFVCCLGTPTRAARMALRHLLYTRARDAQCKHASRTLCTRGVDIGLVGTLRWGFAYAGICVWGFSTSSPSIYLPTYICDQTSSRFIELSPIRTCKLIMHTNRRDKRVRHFLRGESPVAIYVTDFTDTSSSLSFFCLSHETRALRWSIGWPMEKRRSAHESNYYIHRNNLNVFWEKYNTRVFERKLCEKSIRKLCYAWYMYVSPDIANLLE